MAPETCPVCGEPVPPDSKACPHCGSDEETGWSEDARREELGLPDEEFDYDRFVKEEFGSKDPVPGGIHPGWWIAAVILVLLFLWFWLGGLTR